MQILPVRNRLDSPPLHLYYITMNHSIPAVLIASLLCLCLGFFSCSREEEITLEELEAYNAEGLSEILAKTTSKPWRGEAFVPGKRGGTWNDVVIQDPKSFNYLIAEQDSATSSIMRSMNDYLLDYNAVKREWVPHIAQARLSVDEQAGTLTVIYTLRDDLYWSYYNSDKKVKVTSDDVIFWYNEIEGDLACNSSGYYGQFLTMPNGEEAHIDIEKIDDRRFAFHFPRIIADPYLHTNMDFGPRHIYEPAKTEGGADAIKNLHTVATDPKTLPSLGEWFLVEYTQGQRLVYKRNPNYWRKDANGVSIPYFDERIDRIIPDENTNLLLFRDGKTESYSLRPEDLDTLVNHGDDTYTVFNAEGALSASFWTFNQNPKNKKKPQYEWFTKKEFRQAMSCLLNRDRINNQVYRSLAEPKLTIFPEPNPYYNPELTLSYLYDTARAEELLASIGIKRDRSGKMRDWKNRPIRFSLHIRSESSMNSDTASIIRDELAKMGIRVDIRVLDFQKLVGMLFNTFEWDSMLMGLSGSNIFPSQGSNVWPSSANLHLWNPNQESPATEWEARIDYLYNEGKFTLDPQKAQLIWDEFQSILLEETPMIYLMRTRGFWALRNRWDFTNVYYDNLNGAEINFVSLN